MDSGASVPYEEGLHRRLQDDEYAAVFLESVFEEDTASLYLMGLGDIAEARVGGLEALSAKTGLPRTQFRKAFSGGVAEKRDARKRIRCALGLHSHKNNSASARTAYVQHSVL